jgi:hypothetical protein
VAIEGHLGHAGLGEDAVDADSLVAVLVEQPPSGVEQTVPGGSCGGDLPGRWHIDKIQTSLYSLKLDETDLSV